YERDRVKAGYGEAEILDRDRAVSIRRHTKSRSNDMKCSEAEEQLQVRQTQKAIKHALTERYYAFEEARRVAVADPEVDLNAEPGTQAYTPIYSDDSALEPEYRSSGGGQAASPS
ncbi:MAG: hypothetical protein Q9174_005246, partial [Haloplaca sp. 1 TL-2023]